jgi:hypothetical protein
MADHHFKMSSQRLKLLSNINNGCPVSKIDEPLQANDINPWTNHQTTMTNLKRLKILTIQLQSSHELHKIIQQTTKIHSKRSLMTHTPNPFTIMKPFKLSLHLTIDNRNPTR